MRFFSIPGLLLAAFVLVAVLPQGAAAFSAADILLDCTDASRKIRVQVLTTQDARVVDARNPSPLFQGKVDRLLEVPFSFERKDAVDSSVTLLQLKMMPLRRQSLSGMRYQLFSRDGNVNTYVTCKMNVSPV